MRSAIVFLVLVFLTSSTKAQVENPEPQDVECSEGYYLGLPEGSYDNQCILNVENATIIGVDSEIPLELRATDAINVYNSDLIPNGGPINLTIGQSANNLEIAWYEPTGTMTVPRYEKVELGIKLPTVIQEGVNAFIEDPSSEGAINPFDPDHLDVYAIFEREEAPDSWVEAKRINGFYFQDYEMNYNLPNFQGVDYGDWNWIKVDTDFQFRIRFAPPEVGRYRCFIYLYHGAEEFQSIQVEFDVAESSNKGFIEKTWNNRYLQHGDGEMFFPVSNVFVTTGKNLDFQNGLNCEGTLIWTPNEETEDWGTINWGPMEWGSRIIAPAAFQKLHDQVSEYAIAGGNMFRTISMPWDFDIEYEHLNNYSGRQINAWEFDRLLDHAHDLGIKIEWSMQSQYPFEVDNASFLFDWDWLDDHIHPSHNEDLPDWGNKGVCYHTELGLETPQEFFYEAGGAIEIYKKKIRYLIARYGYSTDIAIIELFSEIPNCGKYLDDSGFPHRPWAEDVGFRHQIYLWQKVIAEYIKEDLDHQEHLLASSYTHNGATMDLDLENLPEYLAGTPNHLLPSLVYDEHDLTYSANPHLDLICESHYTGFLDDHVNMANQNKFIYYNKPWMYSEVGFGDIGLDLQDCIRPTNNVRQTLLTPFTGACAAGNSWDDHAYSNQEFWPIYGHMKNFMDGLDLNGAVWIPYGDFSGDQRKSMSYLRTGTHNNNDIRIVGAVYNHKWNEFTARDCSIPDCENETWFCDCEILDDTEDAWYINSSVLVDGDFYLPGDEEAGLFTDNEALVFPDMGSQIFGNDNEYFIRFYNPLTGSYYPDQNTEFVSSSTPGGNVVLAHPPMNEDVPILYFELRDNGLSSVRSSTESINIEVNELTSEAAQVLEHEVPMEVDWKLYPNPNNGAFTILTSEPGLFQFFDSKGKLIYKQELTKGSHNIAMQEVPSGVYIATISLNNVSYCKRVCVVD